MSKKCLPLQARPPGTFPLYSAYARVERKYTEWQIRIITRKSCSIFFSVRLFLHDIFFKFEMFARYFGGILSPPPPPTIKNQMAVPYRKYNIHTYVYCMA